MTDYVKYKTKTKTISLFDPLNLERSSQPSIFKTQSNELYNPLGSYSGYYKAQSVIIYSFVTI